MSRGGGHSAAAGISPAVLWSSFAVFVAFTAFLASRHVVWRDEVRALSVATNATSWANLLESIHLEGHPILWYAILRVAHSVVQSPLVLPVSALVIAAAAAWLILRFAPFPVWARLLMVFGAFLGFEFSVVARNYGIGVLLMICACIAFPSRSERPFRLGIALALMANTSVHAAAAALVLSFVWAMDARTAQTRAVLFTPKVLTALALAIAGIAFGLVSSRPPPDMSYAIGLSSLTPERLARALLTDPGSGLHGGGWSNIAAAGALPWLRFGIDPLLASSVIVNVSLLSVAWTLRKNLACLLGLILAVMAFEVLFGIVYTASLRHQGILTFLIISLCWIAASTDGDAARARRIAIGLLPLLVTQTIALPFIVRHHLMRPASSSKAFATLIDSTPRLREAIIAGDPDYFMETMPYYVSNPVFMPRQRIFDYRVYFDGGTKRRLKLTLDDLTAMADSLSAATCRPVLVAIGYPAFLTSDSGKAGPAYRDAVFTWSAAERSRLMQRGKLLETFGPSLTGEDYQVFEIPPPARPGVSCEP